MSTIYSLKHFLFLGLLVGIPRSMQAMEGLSLPIDCDLGKNCWIVNLPRHYQGAQQVDFRCKMNTYDGHKGTDFAIKDLVQMYQGVNVIAPIDGRIKAVRDGMEDISIKEIDPALIANKECGNGLVLETEEFQYQFCHLKKNSIQFKEGEFVKTGAVLGQVGLSGDTEYPHLHFEVRKKIAGRWLEFDPFYGSSMSCGEEPKSVWAEPDLMTAQVKTGIVYNYGFSYNVPDIKRVNEGAYSHLEYNPNAESIVAWVLIFLAEKDDKVVLKLYFDSSTPTISREHIFDKHQARHFFYIGKALKGGILPTMTKLSVEYYHSTGAVESFQKALVSATSTKVTE